MSLLLFDASHFFDFTTHNPSTGNAQDADTLPTAQVFEQNGTTSMNTPTVVKRGSNTGVYYVQIDCLEANGYELDKSYNVIVTATVNGTTGKAIVANFKCYRTIGFSQQIETGDKFTYRMEDLRRGSNTKVITLQKIG